MAGKQGVATILRQAKLERMIDNYPSESLNIKGQYTYEQYAQINTALLTFLGRGGRSVVMRAGRISFNKGLEHYGPMLGAATTAMKLLPEGTRLKAGLEAQKFFWDKLYKDAGLPTIGVKVEDHGDHFIFEFGLDLGLLGEAGGLLLRFLQPLGKFGGAGAGLIEHGGPGAGLVPGGGEVLGEFFAVGLFLFQTEAEGGDHVILGGSDAGGDGGGGRRLGFVPAGEGEEVEEEKVAEDEEKGLVHGFGRRSGPVHPVSFWREGEATAVCRRGRGRS